MVQMPGTCGLSESGLIYFPDLFYGCATVV